MTKLRLLAAFSAIFALAGTAAAGEWKSAESDGFTLRWMVEGPSLHVVVSAPTEGWVAVGFDRSRAMKDANILIGYVGDDGSAFLEDDFGNGLFSHRSDESLGGRSDFSALSGTQSGGVTELSFTIPLDSGDDFDKPLAAGREYTVIMASNSADRIGVKHTRRTSFSIVL